MTVKVHGVPQLQARLRAIKPSVEMNRQIALAVVGEQKREAPVRTGNLRRSIRVGTISQRVAQTVATGNYAAHVEYGTAPHDIVPRNRKALRFAAIGVATRATGSPTVGAVRAGGAYTFARRVRHPGTRANPFMARGAEAAKRAGIVKDYIIKAWNRAA